MKFFKLILSITFVFNVILLKHSYANGKKSFSQKELKEITNVDTYKKDLNLLIKKDKKDANDFFYLEIYKFMILNKEYIELLYKTSKNITLRDEKKFKKYTENIIKAKEDYLKVEKDKLSEDNKKNFELFEKNFNGLIEGSMEITIILEFEKGMYKQVIEDGENFLKLYPKKYSIQELVYKSKIKVEVDEKIKN